MENSRSSPIFTLPNPWKSNKHKIRLASTLKLIRNVSPYQFPEKLDSNQRKQILHSLSEKLTRTKLLEGPIALSAESISATEKEFLYERFLLTEGLQNLHDGEGIVLDQSGSFLAVINLHNHLQIQTIDYNDHSEEALNSLIELEVETAKDLNFSFSKKFGYLTAEPTLCGTAFQIHIFLHVPALIYEGTLGEILQKYGKEEVVAQGIQGSPDDYIGDVLVLRNLHTLGRSEEEIITSVNKLATRITAEEKSLRTKYTETPAKELKDLISRAFGLLEYSYSLETIEALNALSLMKLAVDLNWVQGITMAKLNELFFDCPRAHLIVAIGKEVPKDAIPIARSEFLRKELSKMSLSLS
jgi:protein arginine kinase